MYLRDELCTYVSSLDLYTDRDSRIHINRLRDLLAGPYKPNPGDAGIDGGLSFLTAVTGKIGTAFLS